MALPYPPFNPNDPIQNNPFFYPQTNRLEGGDQGILIIGAGLAVTPEGVLSATGTGGTAVTTLTAGAGLTVSQPDGNVLITNTGVLSLTSGGGLSITGSGGNLTITNTSPAPSVIGTVTQVDTGTGLTGGPITGTGTIALETVSTVAPGTYPNATVTVDAYGRVTAVSPGGGLGSLIQANAPLSVNASYPQTISVNTASTASPGVVQLNTSTNSTSTTQAATPSAVKAAYDNSTTALTNSASALSAATTASTAASNAQSTANAAQSAATVAQGAATAAQATANAATTNAAAAQATANAAIPCACFTAKGQLLAATGASTLTALPPGTNGQVLIACSSCSSGLTWITQPVASGTVTSVSTGLGLLGGPITTTGTICLAPSGVTPNNYTYANISVDTYGRVTAATNGNPPIPCSAITGKGVVLTGSSVNSPIALPAGPNGYVLTACSACATGLTWAVASSSGIPTSAITGKGALITGTAANTVSTLPVGSNGFVLTADSTCADGLKWAAAASPTTPATPSTEGVVFASTKNSASFATALGFNALNTTVTGVGNVAIGSSSGCSLTSGQFNTFVGSGAGCANTTGCNNIALGSQTLNSQTSGCCNIAIGNLAGINLTTESGNVILGPYQAEAGCDNNVYIADGTGALRVRLNENGALAVGGSGYGTTGQVLTSAGVGSNPTWTTVASSGGTVTSITAGTGLTGGTITTTGTINLANTTVTAGSYTNSSITVDAQGRLTAASSGLAPLTALTGTAPIAVSAGTTPVVSIAASSTTAPGAVQLYDNTDSTSTTLALTAAQGKNLQDQITALLVSGTVELAGTIDASAGGIILSVTSVGNAEGYVIGSTLPAADATTNNSYVIVTTPGTMTPPGGTATAATRGDWFLVSETSPGVYEWTFLNVGFDVSYATTASSGVVCLATNAQAQAGTNTITALTPAAAASAYIPKTCVTAKGALITGTAASTPTTLAVGTDGQALVACAACASGLTWANPAVPVSAATPTVAGTVLGCTTGGNAALGPNALLNGGTDDTALGVNALRAAKTAGLEYQNVAVGPNAMCSYTCGFQNVSVGSTSLCSLLCGISNDAVGALAMVSLVCGNYNVSLGGYSLFCLTSGCFNTATGHRALTDSTTGSCNTALGAYAGQGLTSGCFNLALGYGAQVANPTGSCQMAMGFCSGCYWLTGDSSKNIQPGASIKDCSGSVGTANQVLCSNGTRLQWANIGALPPGRVVSGIVNAGVEVCMDNIAVSMAASGNRSFGVRLLSGTTTATWSNCGNQNGYTGAATVQNFALGTSFQRFDNGYNYGFHGATQSTTLCYGAPVCCAYQILGIVGCGFNNNVICITRIV